jgi:hypothetical protein
MKAYDKGGNDYQQAPAGTHIARCIRLIDLGTHWNEMFKTERHQIYIGFELPNELMTWKDENKVEHEGPFMVGGFYTLSLNEKSKLRPLLASWRGRDFTEEELSGFVMKNILDKPCMLNIISTTKGNKTRSDIAAVMPTMKGATVPDRKNDLLYFSLEEYNKDDFEKVPKGLKKMIQESHEWKQIHGQTAEPANGNGKPDFDDDIPF